MHSRLLLTLKQTNKQKHKQKTHIRIADESCNAFRFAGFGRPIHCINRLHHTQAHRAVSAVVIRLPTARIHKGMQRLRARAALGVLVVIFLATDVFVSDR